MTTFDILKKNNLNIIYCYIFAKIISLTAIILILPIIFNKNYFYSNDFYNLYILCEFRSPNYLFSITTCFLKINELTDIQALVLSGAVNFLKDLLFLTVAANFLKKNFLIIFSLLLASHPYLNLYYLKFTPDLINCFMVSLYFYLIIFKININKVIKIVFLFGSMMRNSLIPFFVSYFLIKIFEKIFLKKRYIIIEDLIFILLFGLSLLIIKDDYGSEFLLSNKLYDLNLNLFLGIINSGISFLDYLISFLLNLISHLILLMGFREQAYTEFLEFFSINNELLNFYLIIGISLFIFHFLGFLYFLKKFLKRNIYFIPLIVLIIPHIFLVAHLRYFMPLIPISIFGICLLMQNTLFKEKYEK